jgi:hypothetical protein
VYRRVALARRVFFSFHFKNDSVEVAQVRNSQIVSRYEAPRFMDAAEWESVKRQGDAAIKKWIDTQIYGTSVTVVLLGPQTLSRRWVKYEISASEQRGNGIIGVSLQGMKGFSALAYSKPAPLLDGVKFAAGGRGQYPVYNWINDNGRENLGTWIEHAARRAGK